MSFSADEATAAEEAERDAVGSQQALLAGSSTTASADGKSGKKRRANRDAPPSKRTRSDGVGDVDVSLMKVSELRAELGRLGLGTTGTKAVLVARLKAAIEAGAAAQPEPPAAASAEGAGPSASPDSAALLAAFDFELSQELKARLLGRRAKRLAFKRRYDLDFSTSHLFARAVRVFGCYKQNHALASEQALAVLEAELPEVVVRRIREFVRIGQLWDPDGCAAGWDKKRIRADCCDYFHRPEVSAGKKGTLRMLVENSPRGGFECFQDNQRVLESIVAVEGGDLEAAAATAWATLGLARLDTSKPHTLTIKVNARETCPYDLFHSNRCIGLMQVPNDANVQALPGWIHELEGVVAVGEEADGEVVNHGHETLKVVDPTAVELRRSILAMGPQRRCCDAVRGTVWGHRDDALEHHAWKNPEAHRDIIDRLQAFDREYPHEVTAMIWRMRDYDALAEYSAAFPEFAYSGDECAPFDLRSHGGRGALCKYVKANLHDNDDVNCDYQDCECNYGTASSMCIRNFQLVYPCTLEDLLPTMEETRQPSRCPASLFHSGETFTSAILGSAPTAVLNESKNRTTYELTVIAQTERLKDESKYPKLNRNGNVAAATATW